MNSRSGLLGNIAVNARAEPTHVPAISELKFADASLWFLIRRSVRHKHGRVIKSLVLQ